jgi:uncharacterized SAM-binding protein YcdF (DUF218 family)
MRESTSKPASKLSNLVRGALVGFLIGLVAKELDFTTVVSYHGDRTSVVLAALVGGAILGLTSLRTVLSLVGVVCGALWLVIALTPLTHWMAQGLVRRDAIADADAVFVLASGLQEDGELSTVAMSRLWKGLELLGEGRATRLVLSELPDGPRYRDAACEIMDAMGLEQEIVTVGPVRTTREEAVEVGAVVRELGLESVLVVTSPSHTRRAAAAFEAAGVPVISVPSVETQFDIENLETGYGDDRVRSFKSFLHEYAGLLYYRLRGWLGP